MLLKSNSQAVKLLTSRPALITCLIGGVLLIVYYYGRKSAKGVNVPYPASGKQDDISEAYAKTIVPQIINELYEAFDGLSMDVDQKTLAIKPLLAVTDNQLRLIFNAYNSRYLPKSSETLYTVMNGEYFGPFGEAAATKTKVLRRMRDLKLD